MRGDVRSHLGTRAFNRYGVGGVILAIGILVAACSAGGASSPSPTAQSSAAPSPSSAPTASTSPSAAPAATPEPSPAGSSALAAEVAVECGPGTPVLGSGQVRASADGVRFVVTGKVGWMFWVLTDGGSDAIQLESRPARITLLVPPAMSGCPAPTRRSPEPPRSPHCGSMIRTGCIGRSPPARLRADASVATWITARTHRGSPEIPLGSPGQQSTASWSRTSWSGVATRSMTGRSASSGPTRSSATSRSGRSGPVAGYCSAGPCARVSASGPEWAPVVAVQASGSSRSRANITASTSSPRNGR